jgi:hypothetical protein
VGSDHFLVRHIEEGRVLFTDKLFTKLFCNLCFVILN